MSTEYSIYKAVGVGFMNSERLQGESFTLDTEGWEAFFRTMEKKRTLKGEFCCVPEML